MIGIHKKTGEKYNIRIVDDLKRLIYLRKCNPCETDVVNCSTGELSYMDVNMFIFEGEDSPEKMPLEYIYEHWLVGTNFQNYLGRKFYSRIKQQL